MHSMKNTPTSTTFDLVRHTSRIQIIDKSSPYHYDSIICLPEPMNTKTPITTSYAWSQSLQSYDCKNFNNKYIHDVKWQHTLKFYSFFQYSESFLNKLKKDITTIHERINMNKKRWEKAHRKITVVHKLTT